MTEFILVRHGVPDYTEIDKRKYKGFGNDLAPLTGEGLEEIKKNSKDGIFKNSDIIISSPYTRALQTASILSRELNLDIKVELDLMEWIPDKTYMYDDYSKVIEYRKHYDENNGKCINTDENFESKDEIILRAKNVLEKYTNYSKVIVVTHGMVMNALSDEIKAKCGQAFTYYLD